MHEVRTLLGPTDLPLRCLRLQTLSRATSKPLYV